MKNDRESPLPSLLVGFFSEPIISDFLFGERDGTTLRTELETLNILSVIEAWSESSWRHWLKIWFLENHHVTVFGKPSLALLKKLASEEKEAGRVKKNRTRKTRFGGLERASYICKIRERQRDA